jgi:para-nitrobenzyl esterase
LLATGTAPALAAASAVTVAAPAAPRVQLAQGALLGTTQRGARAFLGIPYAQPPLGPLRWRAPVPAKGWRGTRDAAYFGANCMQGEPVPFGPWTAEFLIDPAMSEDCLFLNVWVPLQAAVQPLPVLVWIHGGGFGSGSGSIPIYNGASLASQGIVVVTINYRIGLFGFLAHPGLSAESPQHVSGNYGLLDVIESLRWVQANIARFGGDPARVTIAGQSAGAMAVHDLIASHIARGLFVRAIAESGSGPGQLAVDRLEAERQGVALQHSAGVNSVDAMRALPVAKLQALRLPAPPGEEGSRPRFAPVADGSVLPVAAGGGDGQPASSVPLLTGFNADEARSSGPQHVSQQEFEHWVQAGYGASAARLLALYPHADDAQSESSFWQLARDDDLVSMQSWALSRAGADSQPVYAYLFDHALPGPNAERFGSFHTAEVPYVFGVLDQGGRPFTDADRAVSSQVQAYWLAFVRSGDPNTPGLSRWEPFSAASGMLMKLGDHPGPVSPASSADRHEALRDNFAARGQQ